MNTEYNEAWIAQRADPYCYKHTDGYYYFTASVPAYDKIVLRRAKSLLDLRTADEKTVWYAHNSGIMSKHIWAPEIHYLNHKWYLYFAAGEKEDKWKIRPFVLECTGADPMTDQWIEKGMMQCAEEDEFSFRSFSLDATVFEHKGEYYYVWAEKTGVGKGISNLYIAKMGSPTKLKTVQVLLTTPDYEWERIGFWVNEGPAVIKKEDKIFLTFSASATGACYCVGLLWANVWDDLLDPNVWKKGRYPVVTTDREKGIFGPGHNSFTKTLDGRDVMVFHGRQYEEIQGDPLYDPNRHAMLMEVIWDKDGMPVFEFSKDAAHII